MVDLWWAVPTVLVGYGVLGLTGFGSALVIVPLLSWRWPLAEVVVLALLLDLPASLMHSGLNWRQVQWAELRRLLVGMVLGSALGLWLTHHLHSRWPLLALGLYVAVVGWRALRTGPSPRPLSPRWGLVYGTGIGAVEMLFGTAGPVVVAWLARRLPDARQVRASIPMVMAVAVLTVLTGMAFDGRLAQPLLWQRWGLLIVPALAGVWLGHRMAHRVPVERLRQGLCVLLVLSGSMLAVRALG